MTDVSTTLLDLPIDTIVILASGYIGYKIAFTGKNKHHKTTDVIFISLVFGLLAKLVFMFAEFGAEVFVNPIDQSIVTASTAPFAFLTACISSVLWRKFASNWASDYLHKKGISSSDGAGSAWDTIRTAQRFGAGQLIVRKQDGGQLMCDNLYDFKDYPHGPCLYGEDGSIALYVNAHRNNSSDDWTEINPVEADFGIAITYIPASQIEEIEIRHTFTGRA